jgi:hypothetical protein
MATREKIRNVPSIEELRRDKWKVRVYHARVWFDHYEAVDYLMSMKEAKKLLSDSTSTVLLSLCTGGYTRIDFTSPTGEEYSTKHNTASTKQFNRKNSIRACLGRFVMQRG